MERSLRSSFWLISGGTKRVNNISAQQHGNRLRACRMQKHGSKSYAGRAGSDAPALQQVSQLCESRTRDWPICLVRPLQCDDEKCTEGCSGYVLGYGEEVKMNQMFLFRNVWFFLYRLYFIGKISYSNSET